MGVGAAVSVGTAFSVVGSGDTDSVGVGPVVSEEPDPAFPPSPGASSEGPPGIWGRFSGHHEGLSGSVMPGSVGRTGVVDVVGGTVVGGTVAVGVDVSGGGAGDNVN